MGAGTGKNEARKNDAKMMEKEDKREPKWSPKSDQNGHKEPKGSQGPPKRRPELSRKIV